jgi:hypothetical protein
MLWTSLWISAVVAAQQEMLMSRTHGDLFGEIGKLVFAAHHGTPIDLAETSEQLAGRYAELGLPPDAIARAIARAASAVGVSLALVEATVPDVVAALQRKSQESTGSKPAFAGLPSGGRIAIIS